MALNSPASLMTTMSALDATDAPHKLGAGRMLGIEMQFKIGERVQIEILVSGGRLPIVDASYWGYPHQGVRTIYVFEWNALFFSAIWDYPAAPVNRLPNEWAEVWGPYKTMGDARKVLGYADEQ